MNFTQEEEEVIKKFHGLYCGGRAERLRKEGFSNAMPPWAETWWLGKQVVKFPIDLWMYQEIIYTTRPQAIIETGTSGSGSAFFFATLMDILGIDGRVITIDKDAYPELRMNHPKIHYITGDSIDFSIAIQAKRLAYNLKTMVSLDSLHTYDHVKAELGIYSTMVSDGYYLVVEDTGWKGAGSGDVDPNEWAGRAVTEFLEKNPEFSVDHIPEKHLFTSNWGGWLIKS